MSLRKFVKRVGNFASNLPGWVGPAIGAVTSLIGGREANEANRDSVARSEAFQREFAQHGVRWRVEDAKAAGLHPLYALQAQGLPSASPVVFGDSMGPAMAEAGQNIATGIMSRGSRAERQAQLLSLELMKRQMAESDARIGLLHAETALAKQNMINNKGVPGLSEGLDAFTALGGDWSMVAGGGIPGIDRGAVSVKGATVYPAAQGDSSTVGGFTPLWREFIIGDGRRIALPGGASGDAAEVLESVTESVPLMAMVYQENVRRFGPEWGVWFQNRFLNPGDAISIQDVLEFFGDAMGDYQRRLSLGN